MIVDDDRDCMLARRAARLLPEPPRADDPYGFLAWEELVLDTARRLGEMTSCDTRSLPPDTDMPEPGTRVTWQTLLKLGALLRSDLELSLRAQGWFTSTTAELSATGAPQRCRSEQGFAGNLTLRSRA